MPPFPSKEWAEEYCEKLNENQNYRKAAKGWKWPILFVVKNNGRRQGFTLHLDNGECKKVEWHDDAENVDAPFILEAPLENWLDVIKGKTHPLSAIMRRKLVLAKGSYSTIMRYPIAALEMVRSAQQVPVD